VPTLGKRYVGGMPNGRDPTLAKVLVLKKGGRGRYSPLYLWMKRNFDELSAEFAENGPQWAARVEAMGAAGLVDWNGRPPSVRTAQKTWYRLRQDMEEKAPPPSSPPPLPDPSPIPEPERNRQPERVTPAEAHPPAPDAAAPPEPEGVPPEAPPQPALSNEAEVITRARDVLLRSRRPALREPNPLSDNITAADRRPSGEKGD
jgi:hypothetical protein